jgi:hypothetical protein
MQPARKGCTVMAARRSHGSDRLLESLGYRVRGPLMPQREGGDPRIARFPRGSPSGRDRADGKTAIRQQRGLPRGARSERDVRDHQSQSCSVGWAGLRSSPISW